MKNQGKGRYEAKKYAMMKPITMPESIDFTSGVEMSMALNMRKRVEKLYEENEDEITFVYHILMPWPINVRLVNRLYEIMKSDLPGINEKNVFVKFHPKNNDVLLCVTIPKEELKDLDLSLYENMPNIIYKK